MDSILCAANAAAGFRLCIPKKIIKHQECFLVLMLDSGLNPIGKPIMVSMGTANSTIVHPRDIFREAIKRNSIAIVVAHNHPTGNLSPSSDDIKLTQRIIEVGKMVGIQVLDHLIISEKDFISLRSIGCFDDIEKRVQSFY